MREERHSLVKREQLYFSCVSVRPKTGHVMASRESGRLREGGREGGRARTGEAGRPGHHPSFCPKEMPGK